MSSQDDWRFDGPDDEASGPTDDSSASWTHDEPLVDDGMVDTLIVTATNPAGTVSARALLDGRVLDIELSPLVAHSSEAALASEITTVARLANRKGRAAQHAFTALLMQQLGHDAVMTRTYLEHELGLPSPDTVLQEQTAAFSRDDGPDE